MAVAMNRAVKRYGFLFKFQDETAMGRDAEYMVMWHDRQLSFFRRTKNFGIDFVYFVFLDIFALKLVVGSQPTWQAEENQKFAS